MTCDQGAAQGAGRPVRVEAGKVALEGELAVPAGAKALVVFAHGSGSGRLSPRNRLVAGILNQAGIATLLFDLLTPEEEVRDAMTRHLRFDIGLLSERVEGATEWVRRSSETAGLKIGYFGASTGAAAALVAAARRPADVAAIVSRGGRPDLAGDALVRVQAPTLLIVGGYDLPVIKINQDALTKLRCLKKLVVVPGASHLFEEPGKIEEVAKLASDWFTRHLVGQRAEPAR